ncbi:MAG: tyrosine-type recombinase/integrase [Rhodoplanes sp.]|uniref:tyrosine-type recombinase/integrase n=1 Tax=Rhodoplanes sp. TaxID=1968906 RepID=UPI00183504C0|nr:tyrosine-type recombinase/integrase [Rhodoplanes sp.]NVO13826.1 tyrosine-type recombinase/integrase [Rhodoplanes sp.]
MAGTPAPSARGKRSVTPGSLAWLIGLYREAPAWTNLEPVTRQKYGLVLQHVVDSAGHHPAKSIGRKEVVAGRDRRGPSAGRHYLNAMRGLFKWAIDAEHLVVNPTAGVVAPPSTRKGGFPAWTDDEVAAFAKHWPLGTRERVLFDILRYTGFRRSDAVLFGPQHVQGGVIRLTTIKTHEDVTINLHPALAETLAAGPLGKESFFAGLHGETMSRIGAGNRFTKACRDAGVEKSAHGLRKWYAAHLANGGATTSELQAACGWTTEKMANHYTRSADRERLGLSGSARAIPAPPQKCGSDAENINENN